MAARLSRKKLSRYSLEFKEKAVRLTKIPGIEVQTVAEALDIHPVVPSGWRQEWREAKDDAKTGGGRCGVADRFGERRNRAHDPKRSRGCARSVVR